MRKILVISDNLFLVEQFRSLAAELGENDFDYACSPSSADSMIDHDVRPLVIREEVPRLIGDYRLILSAHCKQIFPPALVDTIPCLNLHPGLNPYNRGWYPQVFCIINGLPLGATLHVMDHDLDHGPIIDQERVEVLPSDTSLEAYERVQRAEVELLRRALPDLVAGTYSAVPMREEGNVNLKADFDALCALDLNEEITLGRAIDRLRALTHGRHQNAYFVDSDGNRVYVRVALSLQAQ